MSNPDPIPDRSRDAIGNGKAEDGNNVPGANQLEARVSTASRRPLQLWLSGICGLAIIAGGIFLLSRDSTGNSDADGHSIVEVAAPAVVSVSMRNVQFDPVTIEITRGDVVEWRNDDLVPHTATSPLFDSKAMISGQSWRHTFPEAGNFPYICTFHPHMKGVIIVK